MKITKDIVIIGAGITGLTTGLHLKDKKSDFLIIDKATRIGGVINTKSNQKYVWEEGPNSAIIGNTEAIKLFDRLKEHIEVVTGSEKVKKRYVLKNGTWHALPSGPMSAIKTPLFTLGDKFRVLGEPFRSAGTNPDETLAEMVERRLGKSFLDYAIDPFILGVYAGDPKMLIPKYALPKLYNLEQKYGSFIKGSMKKGKEPKTELEKRVTREIFSIKGGLSRLPEAIYKEIGAENVLLSFENAKISLTDNGKYSIVGKLAGNDIEITANKVITTTGAHRLSELLSFVSPEDIKKITSLPYAKVVEIALGFDKWKGMELDAFGGLIPHKENRDILGVMFMSASFENRAPQEGALFSVFCGGIRRPEIFKLSDEQIMKMLEKEFISLMKISEFKPDLINIIRYETAIPQYGIESKDRFETVEKLQNTYKGLIIGGNLIDGIGMADRIAQATKLSELCEK